MLDSLFYKIYLILTSGYKYMKKDKKGRPVYKPPKRGISRFPKGVSGNLKGRPKGSTNRYSISDLIKSIKFVEQDKQQTFMAAWVEAAWGNASDMSKIVEFMLPKLKSIEGLIATFESSMTDNMADEIREQLTKRFS